MTLRQEALTLKDLLIRVAQGNPGAVQVLVGLLEMDDFNFYTFANYFLFTESKSHALWMIYKQLMDGDIDKTADYLRDWALNTNGALHTQVEREVYSRRKLDAR